MSRYVRPSGDGPEYTDVLKAKVERLTAALVEVVLVDMGLDDRVHRAGFLAEPEDEHDHHERVRDEDGARGG